MAAFAELRQAFGLFADEQDADALTEVFWAALHGIGHSRPYRLRPGYDSKRLELLVDEFATRHESSGKARQLRWRSQPPGTNWQHRSG